MGGERVDLLMPANADFDGQFVDAPSQPQPFRRDFKANAEATRIRLVPDQVRLELAIAVSTVIAHELNASGFIRN